MKVFKDRVDERGFGVVESSIYVLGVRVGRGVATITSGRGDSRLPRGAALRSKRGVAGGIKEDAVGESPRLCGRRSRCLRKACGEREYVGLCAVST